MGKRNRVPSTVESIARMMKIREAWKYVKLETFLSFMGVNHEFEYQLSDTKYVYDLALVENKILIEFDGGITHDRTTQHEIDSNKESVARQKGWNIVRIKAQVNQVIEPDALYELLNKAFNR